MKITDQIEVTVEMDMGEMRAYHFEPDTIEQSFHEYYIDVGECGRLYCDSVFIINYPPGYGPYALVTAGESYTGIMRDIPDDFKIKDSFRINFENAWGYASYFDIDSEAQWIEDHPSPGNCAAESIYGDNSEEVILLRYVRDNILSKILFGQQLIKLYYLWSPVIVRAMEGDARFKEEIKQMIDGVLPMIEDAMQ